MSAPELPTDRDQEERISDAKEIALLAGKLAHEIKNPLSTIRMNMELLAEDFENAVAPRDRRALAKIRLVEAECTRLQTILDDYLKFTKARRMDFQPTNLNQEIERTLEVYARKRKIPRSKSSSISIPICPVCNLTTKLFSPCCGI